MPELFNTARTLEGVIPLSLSSHFSLQTAVRQLLGGADCEREKKKICVELGEAPLLLLTFYVNQINLRSTLFTNPLSKQLTT